MYFNLALYILIVADVDECETPGTCDWICHNTKGSHYCTECPSYTVYDTATKMCTSTKKQNLVLGESMVQPTPHNELHKILNSDDDHSRYRHWD